MRRCSLPLPRRNLSKLAGVELRANARLFAILAEEDVVRYFASWERSKLGGMYAPFPRTARSMDVVIRLKQFAATRIKRLLGRNALETEIVAIAQAVKP